jgi:type I restriction enzyme S subunit
VELKYGYKHTEVGVVPEAWEVCNLITVSSQITDGDHLTPKRVREGYYLLSARNIRHGRIDLSDVDYVDTDEYKRMRQRCAPEAGDILISCSGHGLGKVSTLPPGLQCVLVRSAALVKIDRDRADSLFVQYWLQSAYAQRQISISKSLAAQPNLFINSIERLRCLLPDTIPEQHAIATALSDVDALLDGLTRLIAKKRDLKRAAMQQLLSGQTRLSGFHGEWDARRIGDFADCTAGGTPSTRVASFWGGSIRWMSSGELNQKHVHDVDGRITDEGLHNSSATMLPTKCVLIGLAGQGKTRGTVALNFVELCTNQSIAAILPNRSFSSEYLYYYLDSRYEQLREMSTGAGGRGGLNLTIIKAIQVPFPTLPEQTAIATALADMDAELSALEVRREKTGAIKLAMMQELLTGKTRLVAPASASEAAC